MRWSIYLEGIQHSQICGKPVVFSNANENLDEYHLTHVRIAIILKIITSVDEVMERSEHLCTVGRKLMQPQWKTVWRVLDKLKTQLPCHPAIPLLGV